MPPNVAALVKLMISSVDEPANPLCMVVAQYNPKELQIDQEIPWKKPEAATQQGGAKATLAADEPITMEFTGAAARTITLELLFDGYELGPVGAALVAKNVAALNALANPRVKLSKVEALRRPHQCMVVWGAAFAPLPKFICVITSIQTKYTMFSGPGIPLRATCTVKLTEAGAVDRKKPGKGGGTPQPPAGP